MTTYISLLRGINVSGHKPVKMEVLRKLYENLSYKNVSTYLQSGNVVFTAKGNEKKLEQKISQKIEKDFGFQVPVIVLTKEKLKQVIDNNPFLKKESAFLHVTFLSAKPGTFDPKMIEVKKGNGEEISFSDDVIYLFCPNGYGVTKLSNSFLENKLKVRATTRNWKSTNEILILAEQI